MKIMTLAIILCLSILISGIGIGALIFSPKKSELKRLKSNQEYRDSTHLMRQGGTSLYYPPNWNFSEDGEFFNYRLHSWDGGKNWYATEYNLETKEFKVIGLAEEVYPNLLKHLEGFDRLEKYVEKNGPIDGTNPEGIKVLEDAGFTVKKSKKQ